MLLVTYVGLTHPFLFFTLYEIKDLEKKNDILYLFFLMNYKGQSATPRLPNFLVKGQKMVDPGFRPVSEQ